MYPCVQKYADKNVVVHVLSLPSEWMMPLGSAIAAKHAEFSARKRFRLIKVLLSAALLLRYTLQGRALQWLAGSLQWSFSF